MQPISLFRFNPAARRMTYIAAGGIVLLSIYARHSREPQPRASLGSQSTQLASTQASDYLRPTTLPSTEPSSSTIELYDPKEEGADASWGLPAKLSTKELQDLAAKVDELDACVLSLSIRLEALRRNYGSLADERIGEKLWDRLRGQGFKDRELPLLWHQLAKEHMPIGLMGTIEALVKEGAEAGSLQIVRSRLGQAKFNIIGGQVTVGDSLFVAGLQKLVNEQTSQADREEPLIADFFKRYNAEFPNQQIAYVDRSRDARRAGSGSARVTLNDNQSRELMEKATLLMSGIPKAAEAWEDFDSRRKCFLRLGDLLKQALEAGELKNKDLMPQWKEAVAWNIPGADREPNTDQRNIQNLQSIRERLSSHQTITKADFDDILLLFKQYEAVWVAAQKGHANLDQVLSLLRQVDTFAIACQTTPHSFDGKGVTALDRTPEAKPFRTKYAMDMAAGDDARWSNEIDKRTKEIVDELDRVQRNKYPWNATAFERKMVPKTMPIVWRHEIRKRIFEKQVVQPADLEKYIPGQPNGADFATLKLWKFDIDKDLNITEKKTG